MKNPYLITKLGPHLLVDHSQTSPARPWGSWILTLALWVAAFGIFCWISLGVAQAENAPSDPLVMKVYPDGTKVVLRWSEVGKQVDNGEKYGGAPRIVAYDPAKDGIVPIGEPAAKTDASASSSTVSPSSSVISPDQPARMDYTNADPKDFEQDFGPAEGFVFKTAVGPAFQQPLSARSGSGTYSSIVFQPGIRYDLEPAYNVTDFFRVGVETAFIYNQIHSISSLGTTSYAGSSQFGNGGLFQIPILANLTFTFPSDGPFRGYFGGGTGASWNILQRSALDPDDGNPSTYTSWQWNFVWQVSTGFTYTVAPGLDLDLGYKLLSSPSPSAQGSGQIKSSYNHSVQVGLAWRF